ncbi:mitochondrial ribosomal protein 10 [Rostrohypoxylon terebratum]|nr:mitochondrial ribosomal protein 10 [Rostrohypoxylon terebratum]
MAGQKPMRLPPLKSLRVHDPTGKREKQCIALMSSVLACWASAGHNKAGCATIEQALRNCMDAPPPAKPKASYINYHLSRFKERLTYPEKKKR